MLVSRFAYDSAVYGGLVAIVASAWYAVRHRERRVEPKVPHAATGRSFRRYLSRVAPTIILIALVGGEWALLAHAHDAVIVEPGPAARRTIYVGADLDLARYGHEPTIVINRSDSVLRLFRFHYDVSHTHEVIAPGATTTTPDIDLIGPSQQPIDDGGAEQRTWLTWD